ADGATRFTLTLRSDVHFSDGTRLTAAVVKESFEASIGSAASLPAAFAAIRGVNEYRTGGAAGVAGIVAQGDHELGIELGEPLPIFQALITVCSTAVARPGD